MADPQRLQAAAERRHGALGLDLDIVLKLFRGYGEACLIQVSRPAKPCRTDIVESDSTFAVAEFTVDLPLLDLDRHTAAMREVRRVKPEHRNSAPAQFITDGIRVLV